MGVDSVQVLGVEKRNGQIVPFDQSKITVALLKAGRATGEFDLATAQTLSDKVAAALEWQHAGETVHVERIQDLVEDTILEARYIRTAKAYIIYRDQHAKMRDLADALDPTYLIGSYLDLRDWRVNENSNMSYSLQGLNNHIAASVTARYWLHKVYPAEVREAHESGDLHLHDLQLLSIYCCGWDLRDLLLRGFRGADGKIESAPPRHLRTALGQIVNFFYTLQGEAAGAQAFANFDTYLAPFVRADGLEYSEVKQAMQEFIFNMNVPTRVGFQTPFTNLTMDLTPTGEIADEAVVVGGQTLDATYSEYQAEMDIINRAFAEVMLEGDARGRVFTFPIPTYNISRDFDWDNPVLDTVWEMTAKYGIPYFANFINSDMSPDDARSMCCRLRLDNRELRRRGGGLFGASPLTGSIGVVTLNLPRLAYLSTSYDDFCQRLGALMDVADRSLRVKRKVLESFTEQGLYPYARHYLDTVKQAFGGYWSNHFNTIGLMGMNECLLNLAGDHIASPAGRDMALRIMDFMLERLVGYQEETGQLYNLEASPAEGASYRLARADKRRYPDIIVANDAAVRQGAEPYYTNSTHLPVGHTPDIFEALDLQDALQAKYTGGTVLHGFLGEPIPDIETCKKLVRRIAENYRLPYFTITPTFSVCPVHGYLAGEHEFCPRCDEESGFTAQSGGTRLEDPRTGRSLAVAG